ncbi:MAG: FtsX-like permease family protein [Rhodothermaceae bacterium]|nr:FtsX-like permease family protein [Rhodothermaceae bacterium]
MLRNYLTIAVRALGRQPGYAALNITGLAVGVACCLFLLLFVRDELSYDRFHEGAETVYRVNMVVPQLDATIAISPNIVAPLFTREFPEVEAATRIEAHGGVVRAGERIFDDNAFYFADSTFFEVFDGFTLLAGTERTALTRPYTVVLTESTSEKFFGDADPVGQTIVRNNDQEYEVTGVMADVPSTSHFSFDFLASFASREQWATNEQWGSANFFTFVRLPDAGASEALQPKIDALTERLRAEGGENVRLLSLQPLTDIHLASDITYDLDATGDITYVYGFATVALLILLIACINYMNLATARSVQRAKEVGLRKSLGALRGQLIGQFYSESALLTLGGLLLAVALVGIGLPWFNELSGKALTFGTLGEPLVVALIAGIFLVVSVVAGSYPALYLSGFQPAQVLRGRGAAPQGSAWLRKGLVVLQFGISAFLIAGTLVVMSQLRYLNTQSVGFDKEHLVVLPLSDPILREQYPSMEGALRQSPAVVATAGINQIPGWLGWGSGFRTEEMSEEDRFMTHGMPAEAAVVDGLGLTLITGRGFPTSPPEPDSANYQFILNEALVGKLGWTPEEAVGRRVAVDNRWGDVIGVAQDFHYRSLHEQIEPLAIWYEPVHVNHLAVRLAPGETQAGMDHLEAVWGQFAAHRPFSYRFLDDVYDQLYRNEERLGRIVSIFAFLAIFVACLGLFGLASFTAERRTKEVGVRKVLGATVPDLVLLLAKDFVVLVAVAFVIAVPVVWFGLSQWLDGFAYRVGLGPEPFLIAGALLFTIALLTVSTQALRAATTDPVKALRYE